MLRSSIRILPIQIRMRRPEDRIFSIDDLAEARTQLLISSIPTCPKSITSNLRHSIIMQMCDTSWLSFMYKICMPVLGTNRVTKARGALCSEEIGPDDCRAWQTRNS